MKKPVLLIATILVLLLPSTSIAEEEINLSALTDNELYELQSSIASELISRQSIKEFTLPSGRYTVGVDIPSGAYSVTTSAMGIIINVYQNSSDMSAAKDVQSLDYWSAYSRSLQFFVTSDSPVGRLDLCDGYIVESSGKCLFSVYSGILD